MPLEFLHKYPSFGCNTIFEYQDLHLTYWVTCDDRVRREFGDRVLDKYSEIPKFIPTPNLDKWEGPHLYRWKHRPGPLWVTDDWNADTLLKPGITWRCGPHAMMQIAFWMGFTTILIVGMDHSSDRKAHFWGSDDGMPGRTDDIRIWQKWERWSGELAKHFKDHGVYMFNITPETNERTLPKDDWYKYATATAAE